MANQDVHLMSNWPGQEGRGRKGEKQVVRRKEVREGSVAQFYLFLLRTAHVPPAHVSRSQLFFSAFGNCLCMVIAAL